MALRISRCCSLLTRSTAWSNYPLITIGVLLTLRSVLAAARSGLWPGGTYGLPRATKLDGNGCPRSCNFTWSDDGFAFFDTQDDNNRNAFSNPLNLFGIFDKDIELHFCMKTTVNGCSENVTWPTGCYCLFKFNDCPLGFDSGEIEWIGGSNNRAGGVLPNGSFNSGGIRLNFCCRCDGSISNPINLPMDSDFFLMADPRGGGSCQKVDGFDEDIQYVFWDMDDSANSTGRNPAHKTDVNGTVNITFCYYTPHMDGQDPTTEPDSPPTEFDFVEHIPEIVVFPLIIFLLVVLLVVLVSVILCVVKMRRGNYVKLQRTENTRALLASEIQTVQDHQAEVVSSGDNHTRVTFCNQHTICSDERGSPTNGSLSEEYHYPVVMTSNPAYEQTELETKKSAACGQDPHS